MYAVLEAVFKAIHQEDIKNSNRTNNNNLEKVRYLVHLFA